MADEKEGQARIGGIEFPDYLRPVYANHVQVNHTPWDFRLTFSVLRAPVPGQEQDEVNKKGGVVHPEAIADIIVPANLMHGLIAALQTNFSSYLDQFGPPGLNPEGPEPQR